jgi:hypothetical protein
MNEYMNVGTLLLLANWVYVIHFYILLASTGSTLNEIQIKDMWKAKVEMIFQYFLI